MPFTLQSSGEKNFVKSQVSGQITASYDQAPKGDDREDQKKRMEKIRDYLFDDLGGDFPDDSPVGLVLVGDAGKRYVSINSLQFSISMPAKAADEESHPAPVKDKPAPDNPPAPDKKPVGASDNTPTKVSGTNENPTTASPNFLNKNLPNPTVPGDKF